MTYLANSRQKKKMKLPKDKRNITMRHCFTCGDYFVAKNWSAKYCLAHRNTFSAKRIKGSYLLKKHIG